MKEIILTTTPFIDGYRVVETIDIISSECVMGLNIISDLLATLSDMAGGRNRTTQKALRDAREFCFSELRHEAACLNADAVIGVDLDYSEFSGQGKSMLFLVVNGTAVKLYTDDSILSNNLLEIRKKRDLYNKILKGEEALKDITTHSIMMGNYQYIYDNERNPNPAYCFRCQKMGEANKMYYCNQIEAFIHPQCLTYNEITEISRE